MDRRGFIATSAAAALASLAAQSAAADVGRTGTDTPFGETGAPLPLAPSEQLPLGPLAGSHYPDSHIEILDKRFRGRVGTGAVERVATGFRWAEGPAYFRAGR